MTWDKVHNCDDMQNNPGFSECGDIDGYTRNGKSHSIDFNCNDAMWMRFDVLELTPECYMELRSPESGALIVKISIDLRKSSKVLDWIGLLFYY